MPISTEERNKRLLQAQMEFNPKFVGCTHDFDMPTQPVGHASGIATASFITSGYRKSHRPMSVNVMPDEVVQVLNDAKIQRWVLMGLYGYVGYLAQPRATQDVDVMVAADEIEQAIAAFSARWPTLIVQRTEVVIRFRDPGEIAIDGEMKQVLDLMFPSDPCYEAILDDHHRIDETTGHRIPVLEAAIASKFAALISFHRTWLKKQQDAVDLRSILKPSHAMIDKTRLHQLGELVYSGGGDEILEFLQLAIDDKPFPV